jgi:hypothetical protein
MSMFRKGRADHPMADRKQAKALISEFPGDDAIRALEEVTFWLDSVSKTEGFEPDYRFELYDALDQAARMPQRSVATEYLTTDRQEKFRESKLWHTTFNYWKTLGQCYNQCIEECQGEASGSGSVKSALPILVSRTLRTLKQQLKWSELRYGPIEDELWSDLWRLYLFAESRQFENSSVEVYLGPQSKSTVNKEFLSALMLKISSIDGLTPVKQEIAERLVAHFGSLYEIRKTSESGCRYYFDMSVRKPAARAINHLAPNPMIRYFGPGKALAALRQTISDVTKMEALPADINLGGPYETCLVSSVLTHLATYWVDTAFVRGSERRQTATRLTVVHGLTKIFRYIKPVEGEDSLDSQIQSEGESWIVENVSDGGFGAIVPRVKGDWIKVGSLLGLKGEMSSFWGAGVVRRISRDEYQQRRVGIQLLSKAAIPVLISLPTTGSSLNGSTSGDPAILLSTTPDKKGEIELLLKLATYSSSQTLNMSVNGKAYRLIPKRLVEGGDDFDWAKFNVIRGESTAGVNAKRQSKLG